MTAHFQPALDRTLGRAVLSLIPVLGENHDLIGKLKTLIRGDMPGTYDDFSEEKREKGEKY